MRKLWGLLGLSVGIGLSRFHRGRNSAVSAARRLCLAALCAAVLAGPLASSAWAAPRSTMGEAGLGLGSVAVSLLYTPAKLIYAGGGSLTAVTAFALTGGRRDVFWTIISPAVRGTYVITPEHLLGQRQIVFMGPYPEDVAAQEGELASEPDPGETEPDSF